MVFKNNYRIYCKVVTAKINTMIDNNWGKVKNIAKYNFNIINAFCKFLLNAYWQIARYGRIFYLTPWGHLVVVYSIHYIYYILYYQKCIYINIFSERKYSCRCCKILADFYYRTWHVIKFSQKSCVDAHSISGCLHRENTP